MRACTFCTDLPLGPRPILRVSTSASILIASQAPGTKVHVSGTPWTDASGVRLREWLGMTPDEFYDVARIAILPMGLCYPGRFPQGGDLPPRPECAPRWRQRLLGAMPQLRLTLLVGSYAQEDALGRGRMTDRVRDFRQYLPRYFPLPHPSWRTGIWERKNPWFVTDVLPALRAEVRRVLGAAALAVLLAAPARAAGPDLVTLIPPPPADAGPDVAALRAQQAARTETAAAAARADVDETVFLFRDALGPGFDGRRLRRTEDLFARLAEEATASMNRAKDSWARARPSRVAPDLLPCLPVPATASYPNGHAVLGAFYAAILGHMLPERRDVLWARAARYAHARETCGLHFPSDTAAGYSAGAVLAAAALRMPAEIDAVAREELRPALGLPAEAPQPPAAAEAAQAPSEDFRVR